MNKGDIVRIYTDPIREKSYEGLAILVEFHYKGKDFEYWTVEFLEPFIVRRFIKSVD
ncbi:MAG: hypothetical protein AAF620_09860 [Bacteroidota bacterium]